jgi:ABC-type bacteriocin/lantibiotic exporter with double-glycine peptidase domain
MLLQEHTEKKVRYIKQPTKTTCGPTAIINVLKWAGYDLTVKDINKIGNWVKCGYYCTGTEPAEMHNLLQRLEGIKITKSVNLPTIEEMNKHLDAGGVVLMRYLHKQGGHYNVYVGRKKNWYQVVNDFRHGPALRRRHKRTVLKDLRATSADKGHPYRIAGEISCCSAWFIEKDAS